MQITDQLDVYKNNLNQTKRIYTNRYLINDLHFFDGNLGVWKPGTKYAFFVSLTVFAKCEKLLKNHFQQDKFDIWDYKLQIDTKLYDIKLTFLTIDEKHTFDFMQDLIFCTQFSFPWDDNANLFESVNLYHKLEQFTQEYSLKSSIEKIEELESISDDGANIKMITFVSSIDKNDLIQKYREFMDYSDAPTYYYFTTAFPWYQTPLLNLFEIPIASDMIDSVFPIIIRYLYQFKMTNIIELIGLNLAICDFRNSQHSIRLKTEIDSLIQLYLYNMIKTKTYIKNQIFDLFQYSIDHDVKPSPSCILYLVYTFQNYFDSIQMMFADDLIGRPALLNMAMPDRIIKLTEQFEEVNKISQRSYLYFIIDGIGFNSMTPSLFLDLIKHDNVLEITLDTNFAWNPNDNAAVIPKTYQLNQNDIKEVKLFGSNSHCFIEEFIGFLKTCIHVTKLHITVNTTLASYLIFDNLEINILELYNIYIDHKVLDELTRCNFKLEKIHIYNCTLENKIENWELMINLPQLRAIIIKEDESTWQYLFEFISNHLINSGLKEFKFTNLNILSNEKCIPCHCIKFLMDEFNSKLLIQELETEKIIDLYDMKFKHIVMHEDVELYESAPWSIEAWGRPVESCPLASTRLAGAGNSTTVNSNTVQSTVFCVRCGTPRGVISHWLRAETHRDMASWARALVQGSHNAVNFQREFSFRCLYQNRPSQLIVHLDRGFSLLEGIGPQTKTIWSFPFDKLKGSADDGHRILYLDFGGDEGEIEMDMECCPKPVVFVLHNCLSAKVHSLA